MTTLRIDLNILLIIMYIGFVLVDYIFYAAAAGMSDGCCRNMHINTGNRKEATARTVGRTP